MEKNEFYESMRKKIEENLSESILAEGKLVIKEARKNNDVMMHGIMISREGGGGYQRPYLLQDRRCAEKQRQAFGDEVFAG